MMQKWWAGAAVLSALIIAAALVYHARQLAEVSRRLQAVEQRTSGLDGRLEKFSSELPTVVEQAGNNAGRQAVHGMIEEAVQMPLSWLRRTAAPAGTNGLKQALPALPSAGPATDQGTPWVRFDIREPVIKIEILPNLKEVPAVPWPVNDSKKQPLPETNHPGTTAAYSMPGAEAK